MLAPANRLHRSRDFGAVVRRGARKGRRTVVVHVLVDTAAVRIGGPRVGFVVSKSVGDAVTRHRVSRRLRHICREVLVEAADQEQWGGDLQVVVRALPPAAGAEYAQLRADIASGLRAAASRARSDPR